MRDNETLPYMAYVLAAYLCYWRNPKKNYTWVATVTLIGCWWHSLRYWFVKSLTCTRYDLIIFVSFCKNPFSRIPYTVHKWTFLCLGKPNDYASGEVACCDVTKPFPKVESSLSKIPLNLNSTLVLTSPVKWIGSRFASIISTCAYTSIVLRRTMIQTCLIVLGHWSHQTLIL